MIKWPLNIQRGYGGRSEAQQHWRVHFNFNKIPRGRCCCWVSRRSLTSQVINVAFYVERKKSDKFCLEALISDWGSFTCRKSTTRDQRLYFPSEESHTQDFYALKNLSTSAGFEPANLGTTGEYDNHWTTGVDSHGRIFYVCPNHNFQKTLTLSP